MRIFISIFYRNYTTWIYMRTTIFNLKKQTFTKFKTRTLIVIKVLLPYIFILLFALGTDVIPGTSKDYKFATVRWVQFHYLHNFSLVDRYWLAIYDVPCYLSFQPFRGEQDIRSYKYGHMPNRVFFKFIHSYKIT